jgi:hypothetical protein
LPIGRKVFGSQLVVAAFVDQPAGYRTENPFRVDTNVSVRIGTGIGDALARSDGGGDTPEPPGIVRCRSTKPATTTTSRIATESSEANTGLVPGERRPRRTEERPARRPRRDWT